MAGKLVKRTLDIIKSGVDTKVKDYTSNWTSFRNDAREVKDILIKGETNAADTVQKLKRTGITKKISEWFYGAETEFDSSGSDSDFDPGFSVESSSDNKLDGEKSSSSLTYESMKDLSAKQTGMMVKIGRRQTEQSVANTAEVISTINNRTAEMVAVMNNINTSLKGVNDRLDKLIKIQSVGIEAEEERALNSEGGIYDSEGRLSLKGIFDAAKSSGGGYIGSSLGMLGNLKGGITPDMLFGLVLDKALNKPMSGGKSINQMGKEFNEFIGNSIQTALTGVLESKVFTDLFGNITGFNAGRDYGELRTNRYDTKRAQFDGMTRHSIVKIMPELLIKLNENVSGKSYHINQNGDIVEGPAKNYFNEAVSGAIGAHGINSRAMSAVRSGMQQVFKKEIPQQDIDTAADALVHYFILQMESAGGRMLTKADIRAHEIDATKQACEMLGMVNTDTSKGYDYWSRVCQTILYKVANGNTMDANAFVSNVNQSLRNMQKAAVDHATNSFYSNQAGRITSSVIQQSFISKHGNEQQISRATTTTASKFTTADYVKGIFAILNRGVNVKLVEGTNKSQYDSITETDIQKEPWQIKASNDESARVLVNALSGNKNAIKNSMESALGLLGGANNATGGRIGALNTVANLTTTLNQGRQFLDRIKGNRFAQNINAAFHGDASGLQAQFDGAMNRAKGALPYGLTHDQRAIDAANSARGIGHNLMQHGSNFVNTARERIRNTGIGQAGYRHANNIVYGIDDMRLRSAQNAIQNFSTAGLSDYDKRRLEIAANAFNAGDMDKYNRAMGSSNSIGGMSDADVREYISGKYGTIEAINKRRSTSVNGKPDIGAVRMAAPDKNKKSDPNNKQSPLYKLIKGGFNLTTTFLKGIYKLAASGAKDVFYGIQNFAGGLFGGGKNADGTRHHGLIENLTFDVGRTAWNVGIGGLINRVGDIRDKWNNGSSGHLKNQDARFGEMGDEYYTRAEWREKRKAESEKRKAERDQERTNRFGYWDADGHYSDEYVEGGGSGYLTRAQNRERKNARVISQNYEHRDADGKWHFRALRDETTGEKIVKQGSVVTRGDVAEAPLKALGKTVMNVVGKLGAFGKGIVEITKSIGGFAKKTFNWAADWLKKTSFGKGLFAGFDKAREAKKAKTIKKLEKDRYESFSSYASGEIMDILRGDNKSSVLSKIADVLEKVRVNTLPEEERRKYEEEKRKKEEEEKNKQDENGGSGSGLFGRIKGFFKRKRKGGNADSGEGEGNGESNGESNGEGEGEGATAGATAGSGEAGGTPRKFGRSVSAVGENVGKMLGGIMQSVGGILKLATSAVLALEGLQAIKQLGEDIFKKGLKPLNQIFQKAYHMLRPITVQITNMVKTIAKSLVEMLDGVMNVLTPLLKMVSDAISTIFDTILKPVMEILDATLSACMVPITLVLDAMKPVLDILCADLKVVSGVVQLGFGGVMGLLGALSKGLGMLVSLGGKILKVIPGGLGRSAGRKAIKLGNQISDAADDMLSNSKALLANGAKQMKEGLEDGIAVVKKIVTLEYLDNEEPEQKETVINEERAQRMETSNLANNFAAGDVNTYNTWNYTYGSGNTMNQHTYGSTMNMSERGCGPVALADAYMRRTGSGMSPLTLAGAMMGNGSYEPNRGTSVASMVNTGNALGMNMQVGGVTQRSLNSASPNNPITVMGSGSGFGTKRGNDHYLNVVGSDGRGNSYVSNPLTGRVSKTPTSQLALNSRLGLYGSGDKLPDEFGIDLDSMTALERLQSLSDRFTKIFTGDSTTDKVNKTLDEGKAENRNALMDRSLSGLTDEEIKTIEDNAMTYAKAKNPKRDGESDEDWEARCKKSNAYQMGLADAKQSILAGRKEEDLKASVKASEGLKSGWDSMDTRMKSTQALLGIDDTDEEGSSGGIGTFMSEKGVPLFNYGTPKYTDIRITDWMNASNHQSGHSPLHDFFTQMNDDVVAWSADDNWYDGDRDPDDTGTGQTLSSWRQEKGEKHHGGVDINWGSQESDGKKAFATTGGKVIQAGMNGDCGNSVKWKDSEGMIHWYMHLKDTPLVSDGQTIEGGQLLGYVGNTGASGGSHLHYTITSDDAWSGDGIGEVNPIMYFSHFNPAAGSMAGDTTLQRAYAYLVTNGFTPMAAAGYLGFIAGESGGNGAGSTNIDEIKLNTDALYGQTWLNPSHSGLEALATKLRSGNAGYRENANAYSMNAYNSSPTQWMKASTGEYYPDSGISQWVGTNIEGVLNAADKAGTDWTDESVQIQYLGDVFLNQYGIKEKLNNAKSLRDAFEIGGAYNAHCGSPWSAADESQFGARFTNAQTIYDAWKNADITQWTGYQPPTSSSTAAKTSHTTRNRYAAAINGKEVDLSDIRYRKDVYIYYYQEAVSTPGCDEARAYSEFARYIRGIEKLAPFVTGDTKTLVTDDVITQYAIKQVGEYNYNYNTHNPNLSGAPDAAREAEKRKEEAEKRKENEYKQKVSDEESRCRNSLMGNPYMWAAVNAKDWEFMENSNVGSERDAGDGNEGLYGTVITETDPLNLREEPNTTSKVLATIASGIQIPITKTDDAAWYGTEYNNQHGYVSSKYINLIGDNSTGVAANHSYANVGNDNSEITVPKSTKTGTEQAASKVFDPTRTKALTVSARNIREWFTPSSLDESAVSDIGTNWSQMFNMYDNERISEQDLNYDGWIGFPNAMNKFAKALKGINYDDPSSRYYGTADDTGMTWSAEPSIIKSEQGPLRWQLLNYIDNMNDNTLSSINIKPDVGQMDYNTKTYKPKRVKLGELGNSGLIPNIGGLKNLKDAEIIDWVSGSGDVPALDMNQIFDDASQTMQNAAGAFGGNNVTNVIVRDDQATTDMLTKLSEMTFKVRNERVEELLEELVTYVKTKRKSSTGMVRGTNNYTMEDMFDDEIPEAVVRLSKG